MLGSVTTMIPWFFESAREHVKFETSVTYTSRDVKMKTGYTGIDSIIDYPKFAPPKKCITLFYFLHSY